MSCGLTHKNIISKEPLIDEEYLNQVKRYYAKDWEHIMKIKIGLD